jgi:hypothetical protein
VFGRGGAGKSYEVLRRLEELETSYRLFNSRMTAKGLFAALEGSPDSVHVLEDMERLTADRDAQGVLRSALWSQPARDRIITWTTGEGETQVTFRGGIVMIANRPLASLPELRALATRIAVLKLEVADDEAIALMRDLAAQGYTVEGKLALEPAECGKVVEFLIRQCRRVGCPLDLRLQVNCYADYLSWESNEVEVGWRDLIANRVEEAASHFAEELVSGTQEQRQAALRQVVKGILQETQNTDEQVALYEARTGRSRADFFRKKQEVLSLEFDAET